MQRQPSNKLSVFIAGMLCCVCCACLISVGGCDGKQDPNKATESSIVGRYEFEGTVLTNSGIDASGACEGLQAPHQANETIDVSSVGTSNGFLLKEASAGSFEAALDSGTMLATNAIGAIDKTKTGYTVFGYDRLEVFNFRWNIDAGVLQMHQRIASTAGASTWCAIVDMRRVGSSDLSRSWLKYEAKTNFPSDSPHGEECFIRGSGNGYGYLGIAYGGSRNEMDVYVQGVGCTFTARSEDGSVFSASDADCPLDPVFSVAALGIQSWKFENFALDVASKHVSFLARGTRTRDTGMVVDLCLQLDSSLVGDFP